MSDNPIAARWRALRQERRAALIPYLTAGFPDRSTSLAALAMVANNGADFVELGVPFSDPLADGPVIQHSSKVALEQGMTLAGSLELVREAALPVPVVLFTYLNPILAYGPERLKQDAEAAGVSALLITDLPVGEDPETEQVLSSGSLDLIRLVSPTTDEARLRMTAERAQGFIYLISRLGVTGPRTSVDQVLGGIVSRLRRLTSLPIAVGFGIGSGEQARQLASIADGIVVGSALVERLARGLDAARKLMEELREAVSAVAASSP